MNQDTPRTNAEAERIIAEFGPNNDQRFDAMADYARELERQLHAIARLAKTLNDSPKSLLAHMDRWADDFLANEKGQP